MIGSRQQQARFHSDFYRDKYHQILNGLIFLSSIILVLIIAIIYFIVAQPPTRYYATSLSGQIIPMQPVS